MDEGVCQAALDLVGQGALCLLGMEATLHREVAFEQLVVGGELVFALLKLSVARIGVADVGREQRHAARQPIGGEHTMGAVVDAKHRLLGLRALCEAHDLLPHRGRQGQCRVGCEGHAPVMPEHLEVER